MKKRNIKKISVLLACACMLSFVPGNTFNGGTFVANAADYTDEGNIDGYYYEVWQQNGEGEVSFENTGQNGYECSWKDVDNALFKKGVSFKEGEYPDTYKFSKCELKYDADVEYDGNCFMGVYGWMTDPMIEYFIIENWGSWRPPGSDTKALGSFISNGVRYDIYKTTRYASLGIQATSYIDQYWSIRTTPPVKDGVSTHIEGNVNLLDHFKAWDKAGMKLGNMYEITLDTEGYHSKGHASVNKLDIDYILSDKSFNEESEPEDEDKIEYQTDIRGIYFKEGFERSIKDLNLKCEEGTKAAVGKDISINGRQSLSVIGDNDETVREVSFEFPVEAFCPGECYSIGMYARQDKTETAAFSLGMKVYTEDDPENPKKYHIADVKADKGRWMKLENSYTLIPAVKNVSKYEIYVQSKNEPVDFVVDDFDIALADYIRKDPMSFVPPDNNGDLNRDGTVDVFDIILCRKALTDGLKGEDIRYYADINSDGEVTLSDLVLLYNFVCGKNNTMGSEQSCDVDFRKNKSGSVYGYNYVCDFIGYGNDVTLNDDGTFRFETEAMEQGNMEYMLPLPENAVYDSKKEIKAEYSAVYDFDGPSSLALHGNFKDSMDEFYIINNWTDLHPLASSRVYHSATIDGKIYDIYVNSGYHGGPGNKYYSVLRDPIEEGTTVYAEESINLSKHIREWEKLGLNVKGIDNIGFAFEYDASEGYVDLCRVAYQGLPEAAPETVTTAEVTTTVTTTATTAVSTVKTTSASTSSTTQAATSASTTKVSTVKATTSATTTAKSVTTTAAVTTTAKTTVTAK